MGKLEQMVTTRDASLVGDLKSIPETHTKVEGEQ